MDVDTTQKLSYMPVCPPVKECLPWAQRPRYQQPCIPMETQTVQKLSFAAPGTFVCIDDCSVPVECMNNENFPRAEV